MARMVWRCINLVCMSLTGISLSSFNWVFADIENNEPMRYFHIIFEFLRYWGLWFNWNIRNAFTFYLQDGVRKDVVENTYIHTFACKEEEEEREREM